MKTTYRAMQVTPSGQLELVHRPVPTPGMGEVLLEVEACGICGADITDIEKNRHDGTTRRVPGHEVVGRIVACGPAVPDMWSLGKRVGVGRMAGPCYQCDQCRQGRFQLCRNQPVVGATCDGGYAEMMLARSSGLVSIPDELGSLKAAPLLCAGLATFNALRKCGAQAGDTVAILGIGGLGHMALQYARKMGYKVVAIGRGKEIAEDALRLGAHEYLDNLEKNAIERLRELGGAHAMITMISQAEVITPWLAVLAPEGKLVVLNPGRDPLSVPAGLLVGGQRSIEGSLTGTPHDSERTLAFSVLVNALPQIEVLPLAKANEAHQQLKTGKVNFRLVLDMALDTPEPIPHPS